MKLFMHERGRGILLPLVALLSLLGAAGCGKESAGQAPGAGAPPPSEVVV